MHPVASGRRWNYGGIPPNLGMAGLKMHVQFIGVAIRLRTDWFGVNVVDAALLRRRGDRKSTLTALKGSTARRRFPTQELAEADVMLTQIVGVAKDSTIVKTMVATAHNTWGLLDLVAILLDRVDTMTIVGV